MSNQKDYITDIEGIRVGHAQNPEAQTGCTVILCPRGAVAGVDQRGGAPGTRETDLMRPMHLVSKVHAVLLSGGSAFGLDAASGVMQYLSEKKIGFNSGSGRVPIVPAAVIFDLAVSTPGIRPDAAMGYQACLNATGDEQRLGNIGAGTGASVGKLLGIGQAMKSGLGSATVDAGNGIFVSALVVVNAFGDVLEPASGQIIAGTRSIHRGPVHIGAGDYFADTYATMKTLAGKSVMEFAGMSNTVIGVVATNARLDKEQANKVAQMAHDGLARAIQPAHTMFDGDTIFALSYGSRRSDVNLIGACAAEAFAGAIIKGTQHAEGTPLLPSASR